MQKKAAEHKILPLFTFPNGFVLFPLCYLLCGSGGARGTGGTRRPRGAPRTGCAARASYTDPAATKSEMRSAGTAARETILIVHHKNPPACAYRANYIFRGEKPAMRTASGACQFSPLLHSMKKRQKWQPT